ncbi:uncharacterized protein I206_100993 [Kwoniella pini CBS 10737]|uniref:Protein MAK11 n=1 Tax=Kwoniella pini CBS 10737 TaxID=1296096 RepID=A0A1B9IBK3_9TREE|nr:protein MAK11 [Kwoniella pini CBS 10737]OCF53032.1 protein MAK11 [Kwoniella pini CBS 10737]
MGKQGNSKSAKGSITSRPAPYGKKPNVEVKFEGVPSTSSSSVKPTAQKSGKPEKPLKVGDKTKKVKQEVDAPQPTSKDKGKSKAIEQIAPSISTPSSKSTFVIIAGTYEKLLYGLEGSYPDPESGFPTLEPIFIFPAHLACVKAVAASKGGKWLATGSEDEFVKVWDLRRRKEVGSLSQHTGSITSLHFPTSSHLITTSEDSTLSLFRTSDWALLKTLKGHSGRVNHVDVHPTGRVALSVGKDNTLKMWDLMRGRGAASLPLGSEAEMVKFSQSGTHFAVLFPRKIQIYSLTLKLLHTLETKSRFNTLTFATLPDVGVGEQEYLCVGTEKGVVEVYTLEIGEQDVPEESDDEEDEEKEEREKEGSSAEVTRVGTLIGHTNRIKSISTLQFVVPAEDEEERPTILLTTVSSDGLINLYDLFWVENAHEIQGHGEANTRDPDASYDTKGSRLTCVYIADGQDLKNKNTPPKSSDLTAQLDDDEQESEEDEDVQDIYESGENDEEDEDEDDMQVEFEDEEEEEEEDEGEYED